MDNNLSYKFRHVDMYHRRVLNKYMKSTGLFSGQHFVLMSLERHPNISQSSLAKALEISPAAVAVAVKKLEANGYISRVTDKSDNRYNNIVLLEKGRQIVEDSKRLFDIVDDCMFANLTPEEIETMIRCLDKMYANLKTAENNISEGTKL